MIGFGGGDSGGGGFAGIILLLFLLVVLLALLVWVAMTVIVGIRLSRLCRAAGVGAAGLSYLPVLAETRVALLARANPWLNVLALIPVANLVWVVLTYVWSYRIAKAGERVAWWGLSLAGGVLPVAVAVIPGIPDAAGYVRLPALAAIVVGRWMVFDPASADRLGLGPAAPAADVEVPAPPSPVA